MLCESGRTRVLCTVSVEDRVPPWMLGKPGGWLTAEYSMLPGATQQRKPRDGRTGRPMDGRSQEIQRMVGRALRCALDLTILPELTLWVDCDVIAADGGTRTAAVNGAMVAMYDALLFLEEQRRLKKWPLLGMVAATSVGLVNGEVMLDLDYQEDSSADVDLNLVYGDNGKFVEVGGAAEKRPFTPEQLQEMLTMGTAGCTKVLEAQKKALGL